MGRNGGEDMSNDGFWDHKAGLYALADAIGIDLVCEPYSFSGSSKRKIDIFEGYSPTVCPTIEKSVISRSAGVVAAQGQLWGNLGFVITVEDKNNLVSFFLYDRSKTPDNKYCAPLSAQEGWSRKRLYYWLEKSVKAVYYRDILEQDWQLHPSGPKKIAIYNDMRDKGHTAREAYMNMWGGLL